VIAFDVIQAEKSMELTLNATKAPTNNRISSDSYQLADSFISLPEPGINFNNKRYTNTVKIALVTPHFQSTDKAIIYILLYIQKKLFNILIKFLKI
jgi:hypothetical protein